MKVILLTILALQITGYQFIHFGARATVHAKRIDSYLASGWNKMIRK